MPKSSMLRQIPNASSASSTVSAWPGSVMTALSVSSRVSEVPRGAPLRQGVPAPRPGRRGRCSERAEMFTETGMIQPVVAPACGLAERLAQDFVGERMDDRSVFGDRDERIRSQQTAGGMLPADKGLDAVQFPVLALTLGWKCRTSSPLPDRRGAGHRAARGGRRCCRHESVRRRLTAACWVLASYMATSARRSGRLDVDARAGQSDTDAGFDVER